MKNLKYVKLFESFLNEELSPELKKRAYDAMIAIANDPNAIDNLTRREQARNIQSSLSPAVEKLRKELEDHASKVFPNATSETNVVVYDSGLNQGLVCLIVMVGGTELVSVSISKDKYEKGKNIGSATNAYYSDRAFVKTLKKLIVQIQKDEIPGDESEVPVEPQSVTPEGSL